MPRGTLLPESPSRVLSKGLIVQWLRQIDASNESRERVLRMEGEFVRKIDTHIRALPQGDAVFQKFSTNPYVLLMHAKNKSYRKISQIEEDILPAKQFSSMETSAGRMIEEVALPEYGWSCVESEMHTANSALDGKKIGESGLHLVTLKSGPKCLNDEMSENFADAIVNNFRSWAESDSVALIDFTYGVLYGTQKLSNKKDWHILRKIKEKRNNAMTIQPDNRWDCRFVDHGITVNVAVRIGIDWWNHLGGELCFAEIFTALIRACVLPGEVDSSDFQYTISDMRDIVGVSEVVTGANVAILQRSQIPWMFLVARHFCDSLVE